jgi:hypothetical protein
MDQHVHVEGDNDEDVDLGLQLVSRLLDPTSNEFRAAQMGTADQMALITGTARCSICQATNHTAANCPDSVVADTAIRDYTQLMIRCEVCGGKGHLTRDCPRTRDGQDGTENTSPPSVSSTSHNSDGLIMIPTTMIGAFIGQGGSNIKRLMIESGCNIQVDQSNATKPGVTECPLVFHGPKDSLTKARELCLEWIQQHLQAKEDRQKLYYQQQQIGVHGKFSDADAAANAVQMAYMQQMYWQAWYQQQQGAQSPTSEGQGMSQQPNFPNPGNP